MIKKLFYLFSEYMESLRTTLKGDNNVVTLSVILSQLLPSILMTFPMLVFLMKNFIAGRSDGWKLLQRNVHRHLVKH